MSKDQHVISRRGRTYDSSPSGVVQWTMRYSGGLIKNEKQAIYILLAFVVMSISISLVLIFGGTGGAEAPFGGGSNPQFE